ncbi:MAG: hypothetical protein COZ06_05995 [Armatimonadetes bacterium CG_4_10_14_3_um_filter_66_18]|nr:MAG: hypothetical protein COW34_13715 [Armatimonadetes bacterium CG17_big_fil_post_rev_8_21_14_2_50_66_6]PIY51086.1 MAG: hypothetical protein COZ06_05995 [Armatimonadetes bacterium CG_4_10_14_3_um_filter_66_18]PJB61420.1 MAG: hypothetical protein CO096_28875 [Armatimonadetes bacterium CG_4_9_14_3_um_filter_66_14]
MTSQERVHLALAHKAADRVPIHDSPWGTTIARWHNEGLPQGMSPHEHFGFEFHGNGGDNSLQLPVETREETDEYTITTTGDGGLRRNWKTRTSTPELIGHTVTTRGSWEEHKPRMAMNDSRVAWDAQKQVYDAAREKGLFCFMSIGPGFTKVCNLVGPEALMMAMVDDPDWVQDMLMTEAQLCADMAEEMFSRGFDFDAGWIFDDLGHRDRGFFSAAMHREFLVPAHKRICDVFKARGKWMILHCCGYKMDFMDGFLETGFDCIQPLEVKAGNDMLKLKRDYGDRLSFMGGIDARCMANPDPAAIEREIASKLPGMKQGGGYVYHSDHSVPDDVSFAQYTRVMELVHEYGTF